ncbi:Gfo/Idh/MocA family oxidoreductase [Plantactinospora mayteni]|uniref:Oxidoreductase n=1 Tax=Plantactinospora mayteni TaxID=566021 RepID=A0ABQ4ERE7_9ACTN|nr:Gfo/Idh/MocA family oxidoreductase [Plantactinospora mayteni]GIG97239.1 oxidoreductase [Plantactinospora mayteni]
MTSGTLRVGVVGAGIMAKGNATMLASHPAVRLAGVASRTVDGARRFAEEAGGLPVYDDYEQLIGSGDIDAVVVTTPDDVHADITVAAAKAGLHVLVEKPFTTTVEDADRAVAAIRAAGVVAMCLFNHRWVPAYAQAKELRGTLGDAVVGYARKNDTIDVPTSMIGPWSARTTCAWFLSSHDIDLMTWLIGAPVVEVFATARTGFLHSKGFDTPDAVQIQARYAGGAVATFESAWIYPSTFPTVVDSYVTLACERGVMQVDRQKENVVVATEEAYSYPRNMLQRIQHGVPAGAYRDAVHHFVDCALTGTEPLISIESSRDVTAVLAAAHESIRTRTPQPVRALGAA